MKSDARQAKDAIAVEMARSGYARCKEGILIKRVTDSVSLWVGLNIANMSDCIEVNPMTGVRVDEAERIKAECLELKLEKCFPPTAVTNVGYLSPRRTYLPFVVAKGSDLTGLAADVSLAIHDYSEPFWLARASSLPLIAS